MPVLPEPQKKSSSKFVQTSVKHVPNEDALPRRRDPQPDPLAERELGAKDHLQGSYRQPRDNLERNVEVRRYVLREISTQTDNRPSDRQVPDFSNPKPKDRSKRPTEAIHRTDTSQEDANDSLEKSPPMRPKVSSIDSTPEDNKRKPTPKPKEPPEPAITPNHPKHRKNSVTSKQTKKLSEEATDARPDRHKRSASTKRESHKALGHRPPEDYDTGGFKIKPEKLPKTEKQEGSRETSKTHKKPFDPKLPNQNIRELISAQRSHSRKQADVIRALEEEKESLKQLISKMIVENRRSHNQPTLEQKSPEPRYMSPIGRKHRHPSEEREADLKSKQQLRSPPKRPSLPARSPDSTGQRTKPQTAAEKPVAGPQASKPPRRKSKPRDAEDAGFSSPQKPRSSFEAQDKPQPRRKTGIAFGASSPPRSPTRKSPFDVHDSKTEWDRTGHLITRFDRVGSEGLAAHRFASDERASPQTDRHEPRGDRLASSPPRPGSPGAGLDACQFGCRHPPAPVRQKCSDIVFEGTLYHLHR